MANINLSVNGTGETEDVEGLVKAVSDAIRKASPKLNATVNVSRVEQITPEQPDQPK